MGEAANRRYIAIYCRVSTDEQAKEGVSLAEQNARLHAYCRAMGWSIEIVEFIDDGYSAKDLDRPALHQLLEQVKAGRISKLMVTKLDRLSRRLLDLLTLIELLQQHEVSFVSTSESFDTDTPSGRLTLQVLGAVAEFERERIRERVIDNMMHAARLGKWLTQHPYGYRLVNKTLEIEEDEAALVRRVYEMYVRDGLGYRAIAKQLNDEAIPSRFNKDWSIQSIKNMLTNPVYVGTLVWNRVDSSKKRRKLKDHDEWIELPNAVPAIVPEDIWKEAQHRVQNRKKAAPRAASSPHLLSGLLKCGRCGAAMSIGYSGYPKRNRVYRCSSYNNKGTCQSRPYPADKVEAWFLEALQLLLVPLDGAAHKVMISPPAQGLSNHREDKVRVARARYARQIEAYTAGLIEIDTLTKEKATLEKAILDAENVPHSRGNDEIDHSQLEAQVVNQAADVTSAIRALPVEASKAKLRTLVRKVILYDEADIEIVFA